MAVNEEIKGYIHSLESFGSADGPGVRYIIFVSGCRMRCRYCHNPDTWNMQEGELMAPSEILAKAIKYKPYWANDGGITVSGGEPLLQIDFMLELFKQAKEKNINTTIDTSGNPFTYDEPYFSKWKELMSMTDLVMLDIKHIDDENHKSLTGQTNENILAMAKELAKMGKKMWIRYVLVPGINDTDDVANRTADFIKSLGNVTKIDVLPYHTLGVFKWEDLGIPYTLNDVDPPSKELEEHINEILQEALK